MTRAKWGALIIFFVGFIIGIQISSPETKVHTVHEHDTKVITKHEVEYRTSDACIKASDYARQMANAAVEIDKTKNKLFDVMSQLRIAVATNNPNLANDLETRLRKIDGTTLGAVETIADLDRDFKQATNDCRSGQ